MNHLEKEQLERELALREYVKRQPKPLRVDRRTNSERQGFSRDARPCNPIRTRKPRPLGSHLGGDFDEIRRFAQGGNTVKVERPKIPANAHPNSPLYHRPAFEFDNVARPSEKAFDIVRRSKAFESLDLCKRLIRSANKGGNLDKLLAEYEDYLRSLNLCPCCKLPVTLHKAIAYPVLDVYEDKAKLHKRRQQNRTSKQVAKRVFYIDQDSPHKASCASVKCKGCNVIATKALRSKWQDKVTFEYADIPLHFEIHGGEYSLVGLGERVSVSKREIRLLHESGKVTIHYLECLKDSQGNEIISLPPTYRVVDERCNCVKRCLPCGIDIPNNWTSDKLDRHKDKCKTCKAKL